MLKITSEHHIGVLAAGDELYKKHRSPHAQIGTDVGFRTCILIVFVSEKTGLRNCHLLTYDKKKWTFYNIRKNSALVIIISTF